MLVSLQQDLMFAVNLCNFVSIFRIAKNSIADINIAYRLLFLDFHADVIKMYV